MKEIDILNIYIKEKRVGRLYNEGKWSLSPA